MILFISIFDLFLNDLYVYKPDFILNYLNTFQYNETELQFIIDCLSKTFYDAYAFNEIIKNPPNNFHQNYSQKMDIQKELKSINTKNTTIYRFYQDLKKILCKLGDLHIDLDLRHFLQVFTTIRINHPLKLYIRIHDNKPRFFAEPLNSKDIKHYFNNYEKVFKVIEDNLNIPISSINGLDPFEYITNFGKDYFKLKSPYATFLYKYMYNNNIDFYSLPLSLEDLTNFKVVYDNGQNFVTDFIITSGINITKENKENLLLTKEIKDYNIKENKFSEKELKFINLDIDVFNSSINTFENKNSSNIGDKVNNDYKLDNKSFKWDYNYNDIFMCRIDNNKKVNIYLIYKFGDSNNIEKFFQTIIKCTQLFDNNIYPIIVINSFNPGGQVFLAHIFLELLSPKISFNIFGAFRKTSTFKESSEINEYLSIFSNSENCETLDYGHLIRNNHKINYGNNISDELTDPFILLGKKYKNKINQIKKDLKNPRKPTDIIIFTDGYSYSATALFIKYLQYYGGGITVGYFYNPNIIETIPFDSSLSPTITFDNIRLQLLSPEGYKPLFNKYKFSLKIPGIQTFYNPENLSRPLEYEVTPVDEKADIFEQINFNNYENFINESLKVINKYKNRCNPKNRKLFLISNECNGKFENNYTHGGYICGSDGNWTKTCVASYCDIGYIFDHNKNKCVIDICTDKTSDNFFLYIIFYIIGAVICIGFIISTFIIMKKYKYENSGINSNQSINLVENLE